MEIINRISTTGWHCLIQKHELAEPFYSSDAQPLDAPYWIPAGGTRVGPYTGGPIGICVERG